MNVKKVENMTSSRGNKVPNQFIITTDSAEYFQSYQTMISVKQYVKEGVSIFLDADKWNYSNTTARYRNKFLGLNTKEIKAKIEAGEIKLINLND